MRKIHNDIKALGGEVLAVSFSSPDAIAAHVAISPQPFPILADPERAAYQAFALGKTRLLSFFRLDVLWHYLSLMFRGYMPRRPQEDVDLWQLGGDFVLDRAGRLTFAHPSGDAVDRPTNATLLAEMRRAASLITP